jgi:hypothetical protein
MSDSASARAAIINLAAVGQAKQNLGSGMAGNQWRRTFGDAVPPVLDCTADAGPPTTLAPGASWSSPILPNFGCFHIAAGATSSQGGVLSVARYLDQTGNIAQSAAVTQALSAGTAAALDSNDGKLWQSFVLSLSNTSVSQATLSGVVVLLAAK